MSRKKSAKVVIDNMNEVVPEVSSNNIDTVLDSIVSEESEAKLMIEESVLPKKKKSKKLVIDAPAATESAMFKNLEKDNVFVNVRTQELTELTGMPGLSKFKWAVISEGEITNIVSEKFKLLTNENFFGKMDDALKNADIKHVKRSINRRNHHFAVDYILEDERLHVDVKNGMDKVTPMIRLVNSYAGASTSGMFGFYREVCSNSLNIAHTAVGFKLAHLGDIESIVIGNIRDLVNNFMNNEYYSLHKKFEVLAEKTLTDNDLKDFVKFTVGKLNLFKYEASEKNPEPSKNAKLIIDKVYGESEILSTTPNLWLAYNAIQEHVNNSKSLQFAKQENLDKQIFNIALEAAN